MSSFVERLAAESVGKKVVGAADIRPALTPEMVPEAFRLPQERPAPPRPLPTHQRGALRSGPEPRERPRALIAAPSEKRDRRSGAQNAESDPARNLGGDPGPATRQGRRRVR